MAGGRLLSVRRDQFSAACSLTDSTFRSHAGQLPVLLLATFLVFRNLRYRIPGQGKSKREMARRIDYLGSLTLVISVRVTL